MPDTPPAADIPKLITWAARFLEDSGVIKPRLNAEHLLSHCTGRTRTDLYAYYDRPVSRQERESFAALLRRRAAHEPLQYITGIKGFRYLELAVDSRVLIPRPETEMLAGRAVDIIRARPGSRGGGGRGHGIGVHSPLPGQGMPGRRRLCHRDQHGCPGGGARQCAAPAAGRGGVFLPRGPAGCAKQRARRRYRPHSMQPPLREGRRFPLPCPRRSENTSPASPWCPAPAAPRYTCGSWDRPHAGWPRAAACSWRERKTRFTGWRVRRQGSVTRRRRSIPI